MKLAELGVLIPSLPETVASITAGALNTVATAKDAEAGLPARHNSTVAGSLLVDIDNHIIGTCGAKELAVAAASTLVALKSDNVADAAGDAISIGIVAPTVAAQTLHSNFDAESGSLISARSEESTLLPDSSCGSAMTLVPSTDVTSPLEECDSPTEEDVSIELRAPLEQAVRFQECQDPEGQGEQHPSSIFAENANTANITVADPALTTIPILPSAENTRPSTSTKPPYSLFTLPKTCVHILSNPCLATAIVVTFRCFGQVAMGIVHRFVVLELESPPSSPVFEEEEMEHKWVRFDRRPDRNVPLAKIVASGARANDSTVFGRTKEDVLFNYPATLECQFRLKKTVQLQSLVPFFHIFMQTVPRYRFWRENCWFLSSLIAGLLVRLGDGQFEFGKLIYPNIAPELRRYLYLRYLVETNAPLDSLTEVEQVESLLIKYHPGKQDGAALVKLKSGALVHDSALNVSGMTIASVRERFAIFGRHFLRNILHLPRPTHSRKTVGFAKMLAAVAGDAFMDDLHSTARSASSEAVMILRSLLPRSSHMEVIRSTPLLGLKVTKLLSTSGKKTIQGNKDGRSPTQTPALPESEPETHEDDELLFALAEAYNGLGDAQKAMRQWEPAERAYENGVRVLRVLYSRRPKEFLKPLCLQLSGLAMTKLEMRKFDESAATRGESIVLRRQVCVESVRSQAGREMMNRALGPLPPPDFSSPSGPSSSMPATSATDARGARTAATNPATAVRSQFDQCIAFCKSLYQEARGVHFVDQECIRIRRMLHQDNDALHREHLSRTLLAHAQSLRHVFLSQADRPRTFFSSSAWRADEGSESYPTVTNVEEPLLEMEDLVRALNQQGWNLATMGRYHEAAEAFGESVKISHVLQSRDPSRIGAQNLPYSLCAWGDCLYSSGRSSEAARVIGESVALSRKRHDGSSFLANVLGSYCRALRGAGKWNDAEAVGVESTELWRRLYGADPLGKYGAKIAFSNFALTITLVYQKDFDRALVTAQEAIKELGRLMETELVIPRSLSELPSIVEVATTTKSLPGSPWVVANMHGELKELVMALTGISFPH